MKIYRKHGALIIQSHTLVSLAGFTSGGFMGAENAKAAAFFPFVFVRHEKYATEMFVNHERIHFSQQIEMLFVGSFLLQLLEDIYSRTFLKLKYPDYYLYRAGEQEAYRNQHNENYLSERKWLSILKYIKDKRNLTFIPSKEPEVIIGEIMTSKK